MLMHYVHGTETDKYSNVSKQIGLGAEVKIFKHLSLDIYFGNGFASGRLDRFVTFPTSENLNFTDLNQYLTYCYHVGGGLKWIF